MKCSIDQRAVSSKQQAGKGFFAVFLLLAARCSLLACPLCKESLTQGMAKGFFWSILLMLAVPALVVGLITRAIWKAHLQQRRQLSNSPHE